MKFNWLHNGNALYRTASVTPLYFEDYHQYLEWTWLAFRLSLDGKKVAVLDIPTFRYNNSAESLSKSEAFTASGVPLFQRMVELRPPAHIVQLIQRKMGSAYHDASDAALHAGNRRLAWRYHWQSLALSGGWKYLTFTKNFLR